MPKINFKSLLIKRLIDYDTLMERIFCFVDFHSRDELKNFFSLAIINQLKWETLNTEKEQKRGS